MLAKTNIVHKLLINNQKRLYKSFGKHGQAVHKSAIDPDNQTQKTSKKTKSDRKRDDGQENERNQLIHIILC